MAAVSRRDDFKRNRGSTATIPCSQQFPDDIGQMVIWTHHMAAQDYTWSVVVSKFHSTQPGLRDNCNCKKEELLLEIEHQQDLGDPRLLEKDKYLAKVNLEDMETTLGECQHYWLLAIKTARKAK
jgi:hypothetical protein